MNKCRVCTCLLLAIVAFQLQAQTISAIYFNGLKKTRVAYLYRFISCRAGMEYDSLMVQQDVQALLNLQIFERVEPRLKPEAGKFELHFDCKEVITLIPFLDFGGVKGNPYFQAGLIDFNWLGQGNQLGGFYRYDGRSTVQLFLKKPYLKGTNWGFSVSALSLSTIEPLFFGSTGQGFERVNYFYDNVNVELLGRYEFRFGHFIQFGGAYLYEQFTPRDQTPPGLEIPGTSALHKGIVKFTHSLKNINYYYHYLQGFSNETQLEGVFTPGVNEVFWKVLNVSKYFHRIGQKGNLAMRLRLGLSPDSNSPFVPFVQDSYINIRGSGNRVARGTAEVVVNAEYRHSLYENFNWGALQGVGFVDLGTWRLPKPGNEFFNPEYMSLFYGLGVRIYFSRAYNFILRADYGRSLLGGEQEGFVLGVGQYF